MTSRQGFLLQLRFVLPWLCSLCIWSSVRATPSKTGVKKKKEYYLHRLLFNKSKFPFGCYTLTFFYSTALAISTQHLQS